MTDYSPKEQINADMWLLFCFVLFCFTKHIRSKINMRLFMGGTHNKKIYHRLMQEGAACCFFLEGKDARVLPLNLGQVRGGGGAAARTDPPETGMPCFLLSSIP